MLMSVLLNKIAEKLVAIITIIIASYVFGFRLLFSLSFMFCSSLKQHVLSQCCQDGVPSMSLRDCVLASMKAQGVQDRKARA